MNALVLDREPIQPSRFLEGSQEGEAQKMAEGVGSEVRVTASSLQLQLRACSFLPRSHPTFFWCLHRFPALQGKQEPGADLLRLASSVQQSPALSPTLSPHLGLCMCVKVCLCMLSAIRCG